MEQFSQSATLFESQLRSLKKIHQGKVRDIYDVDAEHLLIVATDRLSAFDVVLPDPIPFKGRVLTQISLFWFAKTSHMTANHLTSLRIEDVIADPQERAQLEGRAMIVKKLSALPVEAVVRGYLIGSGYKDYQQHGSVCGIDLPRGLQMAERLPEPHIHAGVKSTGRRSRSKHRLRCRRETGRARMRDQHAAHRARHLSIRVGTRPRAQHHHCRHQVRIRHRQGRSPVSHRRGIDAGFFAILADGIVQSGHQSAEFRQAIRARLLGIAALEQKAARTRICRRRF